MQVGGWESNAGCIYLHLVTTTPHSELVRAWTDMSRFAVGEFSKHAHQRKTCNLSWIIGNNSANQKETSLELQFFIVSFWIVREVCLVELGLIL